MYEPPPSANILQETIMSTPVTLNIAIATEIRVYSCLGLFLLLRFTLYLPISELELAVALNSNGLI